MAASSLSLPLSLTHTGKEGSFPRSPCYARSLAAAAAAVNGDGVTRSLLQSCERGKSANIVKRASDDVVQYRRKKRGKNNSQSSIFLLCFFFPASLVARETLREPGNLPFPFCLFLSLSPSLLLLFALCFHSVSSKEAFPSLPSQLCSPADEVTAAAAAVARVTSRARYFCDRASGEERKARQVQRPFSLSLSVFLWLRDQRECRCCYT